MFRELATQPEPDRNSVAYILWRFAVKKWPSFERHNSILKAIPESQHDEQWLQASLLLCGHYRQNWKQTHKHLGDLKTLIESRGRPEAFQDFFAELTRVMHPYIISAHGFVVPLLNKDSSIIVNDLLSTVEKIENFGYPSFVNSGTLLGAIRNGAFIPHDDDIDLAVILPARDMKTAADHWQALARKLHDSDLLDGTHYRRSTSPIAKIRTPLDVTIDLFPAWFDEDDKCFVWPHTAGELSRQDVLPLKSIQLHGIDVPSPNNPAAMLELNYGSRWQSSDPSFKFPWGDARLKFATLIKRHMKRKGLALPEQDTPL